MLLYKGKFSYNFALKLSSLFNFFFNVFLSSSGEELNLFSILKLENILKSKKKIDLKKFVFEKSL